MSAQLGVFKIFNQQIILYQVSPPLHRNSSWSILPSLESWFNFPKILINPLLPLPPHNPINQNKTQFLPFPKTSPNPSIKTQPHPPSLLLLSFETYCENSEFVSNKTNPVSHKNLTTPSKQNSS